MSNMIQKAQEGIETKTFITPLGKYTQDNCQVTLTDEGCKIYRPPNLTVSADGRTMWGGLVLRFPTPPFIKGHTYIIEFNIKGKTSAAVGDIYWTNHCGWGGGGLEPTPSNVIHNGPGANWQSDEWFPFYYQWTINDDIYKTCTSSYSNFVQGTVYPSYKDFKFGFNYTDTGTLGTELYINNLRMYDLTENQNLSLNKNGQLITNGIIETNKQQTSFMSGKDILLNNFYEY